MHVVLAVMKSVVALQRLRLPPRGRRQLAEVGRSSRAAGSRPEAARPPQRARTPAAASPSGSWPSPQARPLPGRPHIPALPPRPGPRRAARPAPEEQASLALPLLSHAHAVCLAKRSFNGVDGRPCQLAPQQRGREWVRRCRKADAVSLSASPGASMAAARASLKPRTVSRLAQALVS